MTYLVDSNVICEPTKTQPSASVRRWLDINDAEIAIDAVVLGEVWYGIVALEEGRKKRFLVSWFTEPRGSVKCLDWTGESAVIWGELRDEVRRRGFTVEVKDMMIAATAKLHGLTVATRNVTDFTRCGVAVVNPFD